MTTFREKAGSTPAKWGYATLAGAVAIGSSWTLFAQEVVENAKKVPIVERRVKQVEVDLCFSRWTTYQTLKAVNPDAASELREPDRPRDCIRNIEDGDGG